MVGLFVCAHMRMCEKPRAKENAWMLLLFTYILCALCLCVCVYIVNEWAHVGVCDQGSPVSLVSSFLSEIKVKWVIYHEDLWLGHFSLVCVRVHVCASILKAILKVCGARAAAVCVHTRVCARWSLVFACAMINGLHWAVQPCMFLGLSFYAVSN